jgi:hypothetical protein
VFDVPPVESATDQPSCARGEDVSEEILDSVERDGADVDEIRCFKPVPGIAERVIEIADRDDRDRHASHHSAAW